MDKYEKVFRKLGGFVNRKFSVGRRVVNDEYDNHWDGIDLNTYNLSRPTVIVFGGNGTSTTRIANSNAKIVGSLLGSFEEDVNLLSVSYNDAVESKKDIEKSTNSLANSFVSLFSHAGKKIELEEACKNMRTVTLFAYCYGCYQILPVLFQKIEDKIKKAGYNEAEKEMLMHQIFVISYGSDIEKFNFNGVNVVSPYDQKFSKWALNVWERVINSPDKIGINITSGDRQEFKRIKSLDGAAKEFEIKSFYKNNQRCFVIKENDVLMLATSKLHHYGDDHSMDELERLEDWTPNIYLTETGEIVSRCIAATLCTAVANSLQNYYSDKFIPLEIDEIKSILDGIVYAFNTQKTLTTPSGVSDFSRNFL